MAGLSSLIGEVLDGKYHLDKRLGQGGMGAVFLATHLGTKRLVALKVIAPQFMANEEVGERFRREAEAAGRLRHPNVVNVTDFGVAMVGRNRVAYLVMEYLDGCSLGDMIKEKGALPLSLAIDIVEQVCLAIGNAHQQGVIHRDLKPDNIWLQPDGRGGYHVKVLDFGLAKLRDSTATELAGDRAPALSADTLTRGVSNNQTSTARQAAATQPQYAEGTHLEAQTQIQSPAATELEAATQIQPAELEAATQIQPAAIAQEDATRIFDQENLEDATQIQPAATFTQAPEDEDENGATRIHHDSLASKSGDSSKSGNSNSQSTSALGLSTINPSAVDITRVGSVLGTPLYMSPEQCRGEALDPRSDIYSLGVIVYQMLAGVTPFSGNMTELILKHCDEAPPSLKEKRGDIPGSLATLIMSALAKNPADRPLTAEAFAIAMRATAESEPDVLRQAKSYYYSSQREFFLLSVFIYLPFAVISMAVSVGFNSVLSNSQSASLMFGGFLFALALLATRLNTAACAIMIKDKRLMPTAKVNIKDVVKSVAKRLGPLVKTTALNYLIILLNLLKFIAPGVRTYIDTGLFSSVVMMEGESGTAALARSRSLVKPLRSIVAAVLARDFGINIAAVIFFQFITMLMAMIFGGTRDDAMKMMMVPTLRNFITFYCWFLLTIMHTAYAAVPLAALYFKSKQALGEALDETTSRDWQGEASKRVDKMSKASLAWFVVPLFMLAVLVYSSIASFRGTSDNFFDSVRKGRQAKVKRMLADGANPNDSRFGSTVLMYAAKEGHLEIIRELLAARASLESKDNDGDTALMYAALDNRVDIAKELLAAGADINAKNKNDETPLIAAARRGRTEMVKALVAAGADTTAKDKAGKTALMCAEDEGQSGVVDVLKSGKTAQE